MTIGIRKPNYHFEHVSTNLGRVTVKIGDDEYLAQMAIRPSTVTIYNTPTVGVGWTAVAVGLTGVLSWKLSEETNIAFDYAYIAAPVTYMTSYGILARDIEITAIYVRRRGAVNLAMQLEVWTA